MIVFYGEKNMLKPLARTKAYLRKGVFGETSSDASITTLILLHHNSASSTKNQDKFLEVR
ncbi:hypothetical protein FACS1894188_01380 [Clostridia bacterium]|nr:hypothetical protein FACS1894188_01380 [Clostridia bacterium]